MLRFIGEQVSANFGTLDLLASGGPVSWAGPAAAPVWLDVAREFTERWHHQQHIRDAAGKLGALEPYFLAPAAGGSICLRPAADLPGYPCPGLQRHYARGHGAVWWSVDRQEGSWQLYLCRPPHPEAEVILPEDAAWRLFTKGISRETAKNQARFAGDPSLGRQMLEVVSIIA